MRIVITSFGSYGDVFPYIGLALGLKARGFEPVLATSTFYRELIEQEGLAFHPVRPDVDPRDRGTVAKIMNANRGTQFIVQDLVIGSLRESYADLLEVARGTDLVVTHPITFAGPIIAQKLELPWVSTVLAPMSFFSRHDLPIFPPMPWSKRLERVPGVAAGLVGLAKRATRRWVKPVHALRSEIGLVPGANPIFEGQHSPQLVLGLFSSVLAEPQPDWPGNVRLTGAVPYNGPSEEAPLSDRLERFLADGPPPIVFTLGSSAVGAAGDFYEESVKAVRELDARAVLLVGPHQENRPRGPLPDGVLLEDFAAHATLFPRAAVIVHQGGAGTLHQGLRSGRPTLVVPFAHDQPDNAFRVSRLGVSQTIRPKKYTSQRVVEALATLMDDESYRARAAAVASVVRAEEGVRDACEAIATLLGDRPASRIDKKSGRT